MPGKEPWDKKEKKCIKRRTNAEVLCSVPPFPSQNHNSNTGPMDISLFPTNFKFLFF